MNCDAFFVSTWIQYTSNFVFKTYLRPKASVNLSTPLSSPNCETLETSDDGQKNNFSTAILWMLTEYCKQTKQLEIPI